MNQRNILILLIILASYCSAAAENNTDLSNEMKKSLVYLNISTHSYNQIQPWKHMDITQTAGYGCAVAEDKVLTTANNVIDASFIKARRHGQNEFIPAKILVVDYESNLCLLQLDKAALSKPLKPIKFSEDYQKGAKLQSYWLSSGGHLTTARAYLDRTKVYRSVTSYASFLNYIAGNASSSASSARLYCMGNEAVGIACWANNNRKEVGIIPAEVINHFLTDFADGNYEGFGGVGFQTSDLLDPAVRQYLKMPDHLKHGVYVNKVNKLGTGSEELKQADVILAINNKSLNPYGRFLHEKFDRTGFEYLITASFVGDTMDFDVWRDGSKQQVKVKIRNFKASDMLVPYYQYDSQPEYIVTAGYVIQKLTRSYLALWGEDWGGKVPPHMYHYYRDLAFDPTEQRRDIVFLSYVLPADINLGYQSLRQVIISKFNGKEIAGISDIIEAQKLNPDSKYDVIEFEFDNPTVVIPRDQLQQANIRLAQNYGITKLVNIN